MSKHIPSHPLQINIEPIPSVALLIHFPIQLPYFAAALIQDGTVYPTFILTARLGERKVYRKRLYLGFQTPPQNFTNP